MDISILMNAKLLYQLNRCSQLCKPERRLTPKRQFLSLLQEIMSVPDCESNDLGNSSLTFMWAEDITKGSSSKRRMEIASRLATGSCDLKIIHELCKVYKKSLVILLGYFRVHLNKGEADVHIIGHRDGKYLLLNEDNMCDTIDLTDKGCLYSEGSYKSKQVKNIISFLSEGDKQKSFTKQVALKALKCRLDAVRRAHSFLFFEN